MGQTLYEKIWNGHTVASGPGGRTLLYIDRHLLHDGSFHAFEALKRAGRKVRRPEAAFATPDHYVPTRGREKIAVCISPNAMLRSALGAMHDLARDMRAEGPVAETRFMESFQKHPLGDLHTFAGFDRVREWEREYLGEAAMSKYADSVGHVPK